jgi:hypothetical protein
MEDQKTAEAYRLLRGPSLVARIYQYAAFVQGQNVGFTVSIFLDTI